MNKQGETQMDRPFKKGDRIELPAHYDLWMRGARYGTVAALRLGKFPHYLVKADHPHVKRLVKLWRVDWDYARPL